MTLVFSLINWHHTKHPDWGIDINNTPQQHESILALDQLQNDILNNIEQQFGMVTITYGFTSPELLRYIKKRSPGHIAPELDQHAAFELNTRDNRICKRDGAACDILVAGYENQMHVIAQHVINHLPFDRMYFYGRSRPLHISIGPDNNRFVQIMNTSADNKRSMGKRAYGDDTLTIFQ